MIHENIAKINREVLLLLPEELLPTVGALAAVWVEHEHLVTVPGSTSGSPAGQGGQRLWMLTDSGTSTGDCQARKRHRPMSAWARPHPELHAHLVGTGELLLPGGLHSLCGVEHDDGGGSSLSWRSGKGHVLQAYLNAATTSPLDV